jgi:hypothetical protein
VLAAEGIDTLRLVGGIDATAACGIDATAA